MHIFPSSNTTEVVFINNDNNDKDLATRVAIQIASKVIIPRHIYYADPKFCNNPDELFNQVAKDAGVKLASRISLKNV